METQLWTDIIYSNELAPRDGIYLFMCRGDIHLLTELHWLNKGDKLYKYYEGEYQHDIVWARVWPIAFQIVPAYQEHRGNPFWAPIQNH